MWIMNGILFSLTHSYDIFLQGDSEKIGKTLTGDSPQQYKHFSSKNTWSKMKRKRATAFRKDLSTTVTTAFPL